ncbi:MAG TPA: phosphoribosylformylglycinamidine synthase subunit PurL [Candidatus Baltobacteraceae bacterium]|nr:phosphoribosylformylglycinamidine synthase subunit PurL [Candidatus Baltobacteraceae bacterium]
MRSKYPPPAVLRSFPVNGLTDDELRAQAANTGLALRVDELRRIAQTLGRDPTIVEVHAFDAQWSEHCSYKSSRHLLRRLPTDGPTVMQGPAEDAGILHLGEAHGSRWGVVIAHESHNHPSQVVPFEGAATGVGGIVRDVLCMGSEVIGIADPLRFGRVDDPESHQRYVAQGVVDGIAAYGNAIGIPNIAGDAYFDERFDDNCLVNVVSLGLIREQDIIHSAAPHGSEGWDIVLVGKATDTSGFGGAAFSSVTLDEADEDANKGAVQVPDPFLKNVIMRATYRAFEYLRERNITVGFKDLGAGGIMGCSAELCSSGGYGAIIDLDDVNTAIKHMAPEVIAVGETQERLCWVLPGDVTPEVLRIYNEEFSLPQIARGACATVIGAVQGEKRYVLRHGDEIVMDVPIDFLTGTIRDELPVRPMSERKVTDPSRRYIVGEHDVADLLPRVLEHRDVCSREPMYVRYDGVVRGTTVIPRGYASAGVIAPIIGSPLGVALAVAGNPRMSKSDPYLAAQYAVLEAVRKVISVGARSLGLTDCLNFGNPQNIEHYSELVHAIDGIALAARSLGTPFVSGNVSLYNESKTGNAIPASPIIACAGGLDDVAQVITAPLKRAGSVLFLLGRPENAAGGAVFAEVLEQTGGPLPPIDYDRVTADIAFFRAAADGGFIRSARSIGNGGVLATLAEMAFPTLAQGRSPIGVRLEPAQWWSNGVVGELESYFGECGGFIIEASAADAKALAAIAANGVGLIRIGETIAQAQLHAGDTTFDLRALHERWSKPLAEVYP